MATPSSEISSALRGIASAIKTSPSKTKEWDRLIAALKSIEDQLRSIKQAVSTRHEWAGETATVLMEYGSLLTKRKVSDKERKNRREGQYKRNDKPKIIKIGDLWKKMQLGAARLRRTTYNDRRNRRRAHEKDTIGQRRS